MSGSRGRRPAPRKASRSQPAPAARRLAVVPDGRQPASQEHGQIGRVRAADFWLLLSVAGLLCIGLVMIYSASSNKTYLSFGDPYYYVKRQALFAVIGSFALLVALNFPYQRLRSLAKVIMAGAVGLLLLVLVPGVGSGPGGTQRWIDFGFANLQPSEVAKLALVIFLAYLLSQSGRARSFTRGVLPALMLVGAVFGLILMQPDLGTAIACAVTGAAILFAAGSNLLHLGLVGAAAVPVVYWAIFSAEYRRLRFLAFLDPWADPLDTGFHIIQSLYALGSGGLFGLGLGQGRQKFFYLPEQHTDFIFAVIGEELGFVGAFVVIALFIVVAVRGYRIAAAAPDGFSRLLAAGVTSMIVMQAAINIGVVTSSIPVTGIPLPFISFGGSSLMFSLAGVGLLLNISRYGIARKSIKEGTAHVAASRRRA